MIAKERLRAVALGHRRAKLATLTLQEVADRLGITFRAAQYIERVALRKLAAHPVIQELAEQVGAAHGRFHRMLGGEG